VLPNGRKRPMAGEVQGIVGKDRIADSVMQTFR
jgi:hypothetical protein